MWDFDLRLTCRPARQVSRPTAERDASPVLGHRQGMRRQARRYRVSSKTNVRDEELSAGQMLGRYELLMPIAKGGMGNVWAARLKGTRGFRKLVAIKTILRTLEHAGLEQMLYEEA